MTQRFDIAKDSRGGYAAMRGLNAHVKAAGLDHALLELVRIRVSQLNGCAYCIAMHVAEGRKHGLDAARLDLLPAWREAPLYTPREKAALALTEALTQIHPDGVADAVFRAAQAEFPGTLVVE
ncbi:MAG: carboxymuconolactone decarboxylase family protein, partial [Alphaproteobacteria bacterium]|nr:carboxymuconolactone decarboxylase family protein [Alphaproteobacteria bacterium]